MKSSKFVIDNSFNKVNIIKQINKIKKKLMKEIVLDTETTE